MLDLRVGLSLEGALDAASFFAKNSWAYDSVAARASLMPSSRPEVALRLL